MGWADNLVTKLALGEEVTFNPRGSSMEPLIKNGQLTTVKPVSRELVKGDIVLCKVKGKQYLHLIKGIRTLEDGTILYKIGNNRGGVNGWTSIIYGVKT